MANRYFDASPISPEHPRLRAWSSYRRAPGVVRLEVDVRRERQAFGFGPATLYVDFLDVDGEILRQDEAAWEPELDGWLVREGIKARSEESEALRTSLRLRGRLYSILKRYGDGYFNTLLIHVLKSGPLSEDPSVRDILSNIHEYQPDDGGKLAERVAEVESVFMGIARELMISLAYERAVAERIFADAIVQYLDERFHVTERRQLFGR
jgi:hypothetical protein